MTKKKPENEYDFNELFPKITYKGLDNFKPNPKNNIAGNGFLKRGAACLLTGGTGIGKSVLAEQIACYVSSGLPIFGKIPIKKAVKVLYLEAENDEEVLKQDFISIGNEIGADPKLLEKNLDIRHVPGLPEKHLEQFMNDLLEECKPDLIIIDPYQSFIGSVDINSTEPFFRWRQLMDTLISKEMYNCALLVVTHTPKPKDTKDWSDAEQVYLAMGTSAISNWTRTACELMFIKGEHGKYRLHFSKSPARTGMVDELGGVVREIYIEHSGDINKPSWKKSEKQINVVVADVKELIFKAHEADLTMSLSKIALKWRIGKATVHRHAKALKAEGRWEEPKKKKK